MSIIEDYDEFIINVNNDKIIKTMKNIIMMKIIIMKMIMKC